MQNPLQQYIYRYISIEYVPVCNDGMTDSMTNNKRFRNYYS